MWNFLAKLTDIGSSSHHFTPVGLVIHGIILPGYIGMIISQYKGPYQHLLTNQYFMECEPRV